MIGSTYFITYFITILFLIQLRKLKQKKIIIIVLQFADYLFTLAVSVITLYIYIYTFFLCPVWRVSAYVKESVDQTVVVVVVVVNRTRQFKNIYIYNVITDTTKVNK